MTKKTPQELYKERAKRIDDATQLKIPDRVPVTAVDNGISGITWEEAMYDAKKLVDSRKKRIVDFDVDAFMMPALALTGQTGDALDFKQLKWAGARNKANRIDSDNIFQFVEPGTNYEAMPAEDYDWFLDDPTDYILRRHWPRVSRTLEPLKDLPPIHDMVGYYKGFSQHLPAFGSPEVVNALQSLSEAGREQAKYGRAILQHVQEMRALGFPALVMAFCIAPYDYIADFLRGTQGSMLDMYRCPDKLKAAVDKVTPWVIEWGLAQARSFTDISKRVFIPIHKAAGDFMSEEQHKEFFWPSLRKVIMALIEEGFTPFVYTEGEYTARLETIKDVPKGKVIYKIEADIFKAKEVLGDTACLCGGPPGPMMNFGTPEDIKKYTKNLIEVVGEGGGFLIDPAIPIITAPEENIKALVEAVHEYGVYR
jgi:uroporphyrinogen-III decarboxylase